MSERTAQLILTAILLAAAVVFAILDMSQLTVALVGAVLGQGASVGVRASANGK